MGHLWVELDPIIRLRLVYNSSKWTVFRSRQCAERDWKIRELVAYFYQKRLMPFPSVSDLP